MPQFLSTGFHGWSLLPISNHLAHHHINPKISLLSQDSLLQKLPKASLHIEKMPHSLSTIFNVSPAMCFPVFPFLQILFAFLKLSFKTPLLLKVFSDWQ